MKYGVLLSTSSGRSLDNQLIKLITFNLSLTLQGTLLLVTIIKVNSCSV